MKTFDEWVKSVKNKSIDIDKVSGYQCVDVVHSYLKECFDIPVTARGNACDYWKAYENDKNLQKHFDRILNTPTLVFERGDIVIWTNKPYGHIAIANGNGTTRYFYSIDQNWGEKYCREVKHNFVNVKGCLRPKPKVPVITTKNYTLKYNACVYKSSNFAVIKKVKDLTSDGKSHATTTSLYANAVLKAGTRVTVKKVFTDKNGYIWVLIPSGWILAYSKKLGRVYIE